MHTEAFLLVYNRETDWKAEALVYRRSESIPLSSFSLNVTDRLVTFPNNWVYIE